MPVIRPVSDLRYKTPEIEEVSKGITSDSVFA